MCIRDRIESALRIDPRVEALTRRVVAEPAVAEQLDHTLRQRRIARRRPLHVEQRLREAAEVVDRRRMRAAGEPRPRRLTLRGHAQHRAWSRQASAEGATGLRPDAVSYTHLDVYKRQHFT